MKPSPAAPALYAPMSAAAGLRVVLLGWVWLAGLWGAGQFLTRLPAWGWLLAVLLLLGARITMPQLILMAVAAVLMVLLQRYVMHSREGRAMRAIALDQNASLLMGVNVNKVISRTFFIGSALAGAAGVMAAAYYGTIDFLMGFVIGLNAFTAAVIGGIGNLYGAMVGGIVLGLLESFGTSWFGGEWRDVFAFGFLILFLVFKPTGLLGERVVERV